ncbi:semaphorin-3B-like [Notothenia coriiceps]|uniref:Semaphorin-3B-like n=1 Tax=Notothenia coriiceps TaxID=8208 RepID=A0A6I9PPU0_9TELE|nr:PREDICTED: semaphorin-3B-like [Notothenia coriiceps]
MMTMMMMMAAMMVTCSSLFLLGLAAAHASSPTMTRTSSSSSTSFSSSSSSSPRMKLSYKELQQFHGVRRFELERSCCFSALLLDEERGRLFVGAKNFLLSLSLDNIAKQEHKIYWPAPVDWREECNWAGKDITSDCVNYVKIVHHFNRTHLYACGTGAFHPTCAFVEVGQRMEVENWTKFSSLM